MMLFYFVFVVLFLSNAGAVPTSRSRVLKSPKSSSSSSSSGSGSTPSVCNGHAELCDRMYSNVTYIGAHDSFASSTNKLALARDQEVSISAQLSLGVRLLQAQAHEMNGQLHFCHTSCNLFDGGAVSTYLGTVKTFLDANPNEVVTLLVTNPEGQNLTVWDGAFQESGITTYAFRPSSSPLAYNQWPTLGNLISSGQRLVVFMDAGADLTQVDYILPEFQMIWEPPFDSTNPSFPCSVNRIHPPLSTTDHMYLLNHYLDKNVLPIGAGVLLSDLGAASKTNSISSIMANANGCASLGGGRYPTFVLLDWVNIGEAFKAADMMNGFA